MKTSQHRPTIVVQPSKASRLDRPWVQAPAGEQPTREERTWANAQAHARMVEWLRAEERRRARDAREAPPPPRPQRAEPQQGSVLGSLLAGGLLGAATYLLITDKETPAVEALRNLLRSIFVQPAEPAAAPTVDADTAARIAAQMLDVPLGAPEAAIRAALRRKLRATRLHPDHGGDGAETRKLIAARDLLIAWTRDRMRSRR